MKVLIDIPKMYYKMLKHDVEINHNDYAPCVAISKGVPIADESDVYAAGYKDGYEDGYDDAEQLYS